MTDLNDFLKGVEESQRLSKWEEYWNGIPGRFTDQYQNALEHEVLDSRFANMEYLRENGFGKTKRLYKEAAQKSILYFEYVERVAAIVYLRYDMTTSITELAEVVERLDTPPSIAYFNQDESQCHEQIDLFWYWVLSNINWSPIATIGTIGKVENIITFVKQTKVKDIKFTVELDPAIKKVDDYITKLGLIAHRKASQLIIEKTEEQLTNVRTGLHIAIEDFIKKNDKENTKELKLLLMKLSMSKYNSVQRGLYREHEEYLLSRLKKDEYIDFFMHALKDHKNRAKVLHTCYTLESELKELICIDDSSTSCIKVVKNLLQSGNSSVCSIKTSSNKFIEDFIPDLAKFKEVLKNSNKINQNSKPEELKDLHEQINKFVKELIKGTSSELQEQLKQAVSTYSELQKLDSRAADWL
jgi:uncharacterized FlaG/YvyC family protein